MRSLDQLKRVLFRKREIFGFMLFFLVFVILFSSTILYLVENPVQPDKFSSIPAAMWWAMMTVTTVGYGDMIPITPLGKGIASLFTLMGVLVLALPSAILASGFIEERDKVKTGVLNPAQLATYADLVHHLSACHDDGILSDQEYADFLTFISNLRAK